MKSLYVLSMAAACLTVSVSCDDEKFLTPEPREAASGYAYDYVPDEVLVKFKAGNAAGNGRAAGILSAIDGEIIETIVASERKSNGSGKQGPQGGDLVLVKSRLGTAEAIARLKKLAEVEYAEPNFIYQHFNESNDPYFTDGNLWGMYGDQTSPANQFGSQAGEAWAMGHTGSAHVWIGIIDEGYMYTHEDLSSNAGKNPGEIEANGVDDDGNGYADDVYGWDFDGNNNTVFDGTDDDHGTHVAGTIGGVGNNATGVSGVAWTVKLMNAKFLGKRGGTTANAIKAVDYFTDLKTRHGINFVATSNSWGGGGFSQALQDAITRAGAADILFIAAAGNSTNDNDNAPSYPASYTNDNIIAVASIDADGALSGFSNWGSTSVDIGAPGRGIYSTVPRRLKGQTTGGYASYSGTSMATPHVTGAVALYAAAHPAATAAEIKTGIMTTATETPSLIGKCLSNGRLNVSDLLTQNSTFN